jgi:hypothetical protein
MRRARNIHFGFLPARPTRADLVKSRREFKAGVRQKVKAIRAEYSRLRKSARSGRTADTRKLEKLFHEVYGAEGMMQNPRQLPGMSAKQLAAIERLIRGKTIMATKKPRSKKKKNPRKHKMPAGLRKYWAKKRRSNKSRRRTRRNPRRARVKVRTRTVIRYRTRTVKVRTKRPRRSNPRPRSAKRINLKGFTSGQIKRVASAIRRATGKRVRIVRP